MTAGKDDVWSSRRRMGETLRRWGTPPRTGAGASSYELPPRLGQRRALLVRRAHRVRWDGGAATIFVMAIGLALVLMGVAGAAVGAARVGRHRAQAAADLGALAGAARAVEGAGAACERARRFVAVNGGRSTSCEVSGLEIVVRAQVIVTPLPWLTRRAEAAARAGPVEAGGL
jgi:secretion/DNA translocation related TadE-like protein